MTRSSPPARTILTDPRIERAIDHAVAKGEVGIKVALWHGEDLVVDTWRGLANVETGTPVDETTVFPVFSVSKAMTATAIHVLAERGLVDYDTPLCTWWTEFGQNGKQGVTLRHVLTHRAGIPQMPEGTSIETLEDWDGTCAEIAKLPLLWEPGARNSYLAYTFGYILGMVVERVDPRGRRFGQFVQEEICQPLGIDSFWIGIPESERHRVGRLLAPTFVRVGSQAAPYNAAAIPPNVKPGADVFNDPRVQRACMPAANGIADAKSAARLFSMLANRGTANGVRLLSEERVMGFARLRDNPYDVDEVIGRAPLVGHGGYFIAGDYPPGEPIVGNAPNVLCQPGGGQTIAWGDLDRHFAAAITHNRMFGNVPPIAEEDHPFHEIGTAVRAIVAERIAS